MPNVMMTGVMVIAAAGVLVSAARDAAPGTTQPSSKVFTMEPIGWVRMNDGSTWIEIDRRVEDGLMGLEDFSHVWVFWWFDRNDTPSNRRILQVHPRGDARNPLTGVFATRAPVRPNLIALTLCQVTSVDGNRIRVAGMDAFDGTPVIDLKPYIPALDRPDNVRVPDWLDGPTPTRSTASAPP